MKLIPHPAIQIFVWVLLALIVQRLQPLPLFILSAILLGIALKLCATELLRLLRRTRWILFSLVLIYAYTTPGAAVWPRLGVASPTHEGLIDGLLQLGRLLSILSSLAILLVLLSQAQFMSGLYTLAYPLRWLGLSRERIAVRLALTLQYAESSMSATANDWKTAIHVAMQPSVRESSHVELQIETFGMIDALLFITCVAVAIRMW